eukprot:sb/3476347/
MYHSARLVRGRLPGDTIIMSTLIVIKRQVPGKRHVPGPVYDDQTCAYYGLSSIEIMMMHQATWSIYSLTGPVYDDQTCAYYGLSLIEIIIFMMHQASIIMLTITVCARWLTSTWLTLT